MNMIYNHYVFCSYMTDFHCDRGWPWRSKIQGTDGPLNSFSPFVGTQLGRDTFALFLTCMMREVHPHRMESGLRACIDRPLCNMQEARGILPRTYHVSNSNDCLWDDTKMQRTQSLPLATVSHPRRLVRNKEAYPEYLNTDAS
jgi:hypothetical protein